MRKVFWKCLTMFTAGLALALDPGGLSWAHDGHEHGAPLRVSHIHIPVLKKAFHRGPIIRSRNRLKNKSG